MLNSMCAAIVMMPLMYIVMKMKNKTIELVSKLLAASVSDD